jgi:uncharacterized membrane protein
MSLDDGDSLRLSDKFAFFRGLKTDKSSGRRDVPLNDLVTLLNDPLVLSNVGASQAEVDNLKTNLAINTLNDVIVEGRTVFEMVDQVSDGFADETGVDTGASIDASYNAAGDYYEPTQAGAANLLIHADGTLGSTTFTDETGTHTVTAVGDAQIDTAQSKFGGASALFDGTGDYLSVPDSADWHFGSGDFTVDAWVRVANTTGVKTVVGQYNTTSENGWVLHINAANIQFAYSTDGTDGVAITSTTTPISANIWHHVAAVRDGNTLTLYVDGVSEQTADLTGITFFNASSLAFVGSQTPTINPMNGHIDELRLLKGTAAWTTGFTPPTSAYSLTPQNMTLTSEGFTADTAPTHARLTVLFDPVDVVTLNTDLIFSVSIDDGTTFATATMEYVQDYTADIRILTCDEIDLSGITSGTEVVIQAETANEKNLKIHGWVIQWR